MRPKAPASPRSMHRSSTPSRSPGKRSERHIKIATVVLGHGMGGIAMKLPQTGGCHGGRIRYEITEAPQLVYTCHCTDCQRLTSSAFSLGIVVAETGFRLSGIEPRPLQRTADSGRTDTRWVCPECGTWVCSPPREGVARVRGGTLDDTSWLSTTVALTS